MIWCGVLSYSDDELYFSIFKKSGMLGLAPFEEKRVWVG